MEKTLITGASSGIGKELAQIMASKGHDLVLVARSEADLLKVKISIEEKFKVKVQTFVSDLSKMGAAERLYQQTKDLGVEILVNNAGVGLFGDFFEQSIDKQTEMANLNMISLMQLCQLFGRDFVAKKKGRILNTASIVAFFPGPKQPAYYATKAFVRSLSRALAYYLKDSGVTVTALHPGITKTHFFETANAGFFKKGADPKDVALLGYKAMIAGKIEVTHGLWNQFLTNVFVRMVPYRLQTLIVDKSSEV